MGRFGHFVRCARISCPVSQAPQPQPSRRHRAFETADATEFGATINSMRSLVVLTALALPACGVELKIDHVTIAGARLGEMREAFSAATGVPTEYGGPHSNRATEMALASFPDGSYIELIGIQPGADPAAVSAHAWGKFLWN